MAKPVILITGANGQLGNEIRVLAALLDDHQFIFTDKEELLIDNAEAVADFFAQHQPGYCINCAAYTAVDKAETDKEIAYAVNATATGILAAASRRHNAKFLHISTDYVFDGQSPVPYKPDSPTNPINVYGDSKLKGEQLCQQENADAIIIRTAWVYSEFGHNFVKTMLRLMKERPEISVVSDQVGAPTYAADLAQVIIHIITTEQWVPGTYHFSNKGRISWYDFAVGIKELTHSNCQVNPIDTAQYPTPAKRPAFSLLDTHKIVDTFQCEVPEWKDGLERCLQKILS
jgi:dTDP-4-dehydrorhamnose reductase